MSEGAGGNPRRLEPAPSGTKENEVVRKLMAIVGCGILFVGIGNAIFNPIPLWAMAIWAISGMAVGAVAVDENG